MGPVIAARISLNDAPEGFELPSGRPEIVTRTIHGSSWSVEMLTVDIPEEYIGVVIEKLGARKAEMRKMQTITTARAHRIPRPQPAASSACAARCWPKPRNHRHEFHSSMATPNGWEASLIAPRCPHLGRTGSTTTMPSNALQERANSSSPRVEVTRHDRGQHSRETISSQRRSERSSPTCELHLR